ncbi:hypothetical protein HK104_007978 [Borealophlyctis nickersoniae]|nr:hypothetical protein HK104_007978 [Borealophlyctis nickersoniae]
MASVPAIVEPRTDSTSPNAPKTVLVALDESKHSTAALNWAFDYILNSGDHLVVAVVAEREDEEAVKSRVKTLLRAVWESNEKNVVMTIRVLTTGSASSKAGELICKVADELQPAMLVLGSAGKSHVQGLLIGSVSNYCIQHAGVPVIVARMTPADEEKSARGRRLSFSGQGSAAEQRKRSKSPLIR